MKHNLTAIIYDKRGVVLSIGKNSYVKTHPYQAKMAAECNDEHKIFLHAEIDAIIKCNAIERAHRISVFRTTTGGKYALARPCKICAAAIAKTPIRVIEHT